MTSSSSGLDSTWSHTTAEIPTRGLVVARAATPAECAQLAKDLDILAVTRFDARYRIVPVSGGRYRLSGEVRADVTQACVVTLDPVAATVEDKLDVEFRPAGEIPSEPSAAEAELAILDAEEHEPIENHCLAVGRVLVESLAAALPTHPRAPDAALERHEAGPVDGAGASPFAALAGWKPRKD